MSDPKDDKTKTQTEGATQAADDPTKDKSKDDKTKEIKVTVDTGNIEDLIKRLKEVETERENMSKELATVTAEKGKIETSFKEKKAEADDYASKLNLVMEEKLNVKRKIIMEEAAKYIKDPERLKKVEEKMKTPEDVKATEFMIETLANAFTEGAETHKKLSEEEQKAADEAVKKAAEAKAAEKAADPIGKGGAGQATLDQQSGTKTGQEYDSNDAMIRDLRKRSHSEDPVVKAEAQAILDELYLKWGEAVRKDYDGRYKAINVERKDQPKVTDMAKEGGAAIPNPKAAKKRRVD